MKYFGLENLIDTRGKAVCFAGVPDVHEDSEMKRLVELVYQPDPRTGLSSSELSVLVSDSVNPQIADWVRNQILRPVPFTPSSVKNGQQIDDDTLLALTRDFDESQSSYIDRVNDLLVQWNKNDKGD